MMFARILVPLDGSARAENALPVAARIARAYGSTIILFRVASAPVEYGPYMAPTASFAREAIEADVKEATDYLEGVAKKDALAGLSIEVKALFGAVSPTIIDAARTFDASLIMMCSHGYSGVRRWVLGSVADRVARYAPVPVCILREGASLPAMAADRPVRALVALDGSPFSEEVFEPVAYLVAGLAYDTSHRGELRLLRVIDLPFTSGMLRSQTYIDTETRELARKEAREYLEKLVTRLQEAGLAGLNITASTTLESDPDVAEAVIKTAETGEGGPCDLIAMATHGRSGVQHFVMGSVAERVLHHTKLPMLIVRPQATRPAAQPEATGERAGHEEEVVIEAVEVGLQGGSSNLP